MEIIEDLLPDISIKPENSPNDFIHRMYEIAKNFSGIDSIKCKGSNESTISLSIEFKETEKYGLDNLYGLFSVWSWDNERVWIELLSKTWAIYPPSYSQYVQFIKKLLGPLLSAYNKGYQTNRRFNIPKKENLEPKLSPVLSKVFDRFVDSANKSFLHQRDWRNFYSFVRVCHNRKAKLDAEELERLLLKAGFSKFYSEKLTCVYEHGRGILRKEFYPEHIQKLLFSDEYNKNKAI